MTRRWRSLHQPPAQEEGPTPWHPPEPELYTGVMDLPLPPELETRLARAAADRGCESTALAKEAIARFLDYDQWFVREVEKGLAAADRGEFIEHEAIRSLIESRYPG